MFAAEARFFPLIIHTIRDPVSAADVDLMRVFYRELHTRKQPYLHLVDARTTSRPEATVRAKLAEFTKEMLPASALYQVCNAIVLDSRVAAGVMTALRWAVPAPAPEKYLSSFPSALQWVDEHARARGLLISAEARAFVGALTHGNASVG